MLTLYAALDVASGTVIGDCPNGDYLYVTNYGSNGLSAYSIGSNGALTAGTSTTGGNPLGVAM